MLIYKYRNVESNGPERNYYQGLDRQQQQRQRPAARARVHSGVTGAEIKESNKYENNAKKSELSMGNTVTFYLPYIERELKTGTPS